VKTSTFTGQLLKTVAIFSIVTLLASNLWAGTINAQYERCEGGIKKTCCSTSIDGGTVAFSWYPVKSFNVTCPLAAKEPGATGVPGCTPEEGCQGVSGPSQQRR